MMNGGSSELSSMAGIVGFHRVHLSSAHELPQVP